MIGVMSVITVHELGHYFMSQYYNVDASLPYLIPVPSFIGTAGAFIKMNGRVPNRQALFDIGIAGPIAGLIPTGILLAIGVALPQTNGLTRTAVSPDILIGIPPLIKIISYLVGDPITQDVIAASNLNPILVAGWVGMLVTMLNLLPVGMLDGGHVMRATLGKHYEPVAPLVPVILFTTGSLFIHLTDVPTLTILTTWGLWGVLSLFIVTRGFIQPLNDTTPVGMKRKALTAITYGIAILCFTPFPIQVLF